MNKIKKYKGGDPRQKMQGDIAILEIDIPEGIEFSPFPKDERLIVGHSETGHHHTIVKERGAELEFAKDDLGYFLRVKSGVAQIVHEKVDGHETQELQKGTYYFSHQYEYDEREDRKVVD